MSTTVEITPVVASAIGMVGRVVTVGNRQFKIHSVEGTDWYAFDDQGMTTVDFAMAKASWITFPLATIIPSGHKIGDGFAETVALDQCRPGVCLAKSYV
jgi:hypothetical protein